jgi:adenylyltransferase/sulfurtransferase
VNIRRDETCPACGTREIRELIDYEQFCGTPLPHKAEPMVSEVNGIKQMTPAELNQKLVGGEDLELVDVREPFEWDIARIDSARLLPLGDLAGQMNTLDRNRLIVLQCKTGRRSQKAAEQLRDAGFTRVANLAGGIFRWSDEVDPDVPKY